MNQQPENVIEERNFTACYNSRDLILYAISCGFGSSSRHYIENEKKNKSPDTNNELSYLYEQHGDFSAVPTFCLALSFWAHDARNKATSYAIPPFPPLSMTATVMIPIRYILDNNLANDSSSYPILHMWQSIQWHQVLPVPNNTSSSVTTNLNCKILTIAPKKIGTFVTSETTITEEASHTLLCTLQSTALVLGIPPKAVMAKDISATKPTTAVPLVPNRQTPDFELTYQTASTQSLLYRLASGDSNRIHVLGDPVLSQKLNLSGTKPILHGLCTFGIATRAILQYLGQSSTTAPCSRLTHLEGKFSKPVFIEDTVIVKLWELSSLECDERRRNNNPLSFAKREISFQVHNLTTSTIAVDQGYAIAINDGPALQRSRSKL